MSSLFRNSLAFVVGYVILMIPTYLLPWLGSNSSILNAVGASIGHGMTPLWWAHAWCLVMLMLMAWIRGDFIGKKYLPVFPFLAAVFDLTPGLSMIPLIPTALHLAAIIIGVRIIDQQPITDNVAVASSWGAISRKSGILAGLITVAAISGSVLFVTTSKKSLSEFAEHRNGVPIKSSPEKSELSSTDPTHPEKVDTPLLTNHAASGKHAAAEKHQHAQEGAAGNDQNKKIGKVRYINLNE